jgi:hypothetical protein
VGQTYRHAAPSTVAAGTGAQVPVRLRTNRRLPVLARLDDGSHLALRHTLADGRVLRSTDRTGFEQTLLTVYQALRRAMVTAIESRPGIDPDRASFTTALETAKDLLINATQTTDPR